MTRHLKTFALTGILVAVATPSLACEWHGANGWGGMHQSKWGSFAPKAMTEDPALVDPLSIDLGLADGETGDASMMTPRPATLRAKPKPSFTNAADRASRTARARVFGADAAQPVASDGESDAKSERTSEADAETVR